MDSSCSRRPGVMGGYLAALLAVAVIFALSGCPKKAAPPASTGGAGPASTGSSADGEVALTADLVENWIDSIADAKVAAILAEVKPPGQVPMAQLAETAGKAAERPELGEAVKAYGFDDGTHWATVTNRVYAGLLPMMIEQAKEQAAKAIRDAGKAEAAAKEMDGKIDEVKAAFGELTDAEMKVIEDAMEDITKAMG